MTTLPKDYVILGHIKDINVPKSWDTTDFNGGYKDRTSGWAWRYSYGNSKSGWNLVSSYKSWMEKNSDMIIAALPNSPLYNMNLKKMQNPAPDGYTVLGLVNKIKTPQSWKTLHGYDDELAFAWRCTESGNDFWRVCDKGWLSDDKNILVAARPDTTLYNMNIPKKKSRPTVKQVKELTHKILDLERDKIVLEMENNKLREQLAAIGKIIKGG